MHYAQKSFEPMVAEVAADYRQRRITLKWGTVFWLTLLTMLMLTVMQVQDFGSEWLRFGWGWMGWFCLVPWVLAMAGSPKGFKAGLISYLLGFVYFLVNLYWLVWVTAAGWIALSFYLAWYFVLAGYIVRGVYLKWRWPLTVVLPVIWVGQEYLRARLMTGFPWFFLGHSQHDNLRIIQICDMVGVYGVTFMLVMVNGLICDLLLRPLRQHKGQQKKALLSTGPLFFLTFSCFLGIMLYGQYRLKHMNENMEVGPRITVVQDVIPQYVKEAGKSDEEIFKGYLKLTEGALKAMPKPDLVVWPETMVPGYLNQEFLSINPENMTKEGKELLQECRSYDNRLREISQKGVNLLVGAPALAVNEDGELARYNSAFLYLPDGRRYAKRYDKMHLVPFGEVVPFKKSWPWLHKFLINLTPYGYEYSLEAGREPTVFEFTDCRNEKLKFSVAICYEDVMPQIPRRLSGMENGKKRIDFLLNISNDGWFAHGGKDDKPLKSSTELVQHLVICQFRAIENRVGIARAVNTGISAIIRPDGRIQKKPLVGSLSEEPRERQLEKGYLTDSISYEKRVTLYNRLGDTFAVVCTVLMGLVLGAVIWRARK